MRKDPLLKYVAIPAVTALMLACGGCAGAPGAAPPLRLLSPPAADGPAADTPAAAWWDHSGDPLLDQLVREGLADNAVLACEALAVQDATPRHGVGVARLWHGQAGRRAHAAQTARRYRWTARRLRLAADIGVAYVTARGWQEKLALRMAMPEALKDNADIARFRREAGLVSGIDGGLAGLMVGLNAGDIDAALNAFVTAVDALARLTGVPAETLRARLGASGQVPLLVDGGAGAEDLSRRPDLRALEARLVPQLARRKLTQAEVDAEVNKAATGADAGDWADDWRQAVVAAQAELRRDRDAIAQAQARAAALDPVDADAARTLADARLAYRNGVEKFATLYVAEAAALAGREARVEARAATATATIRLWSAQGRGTDGLMDAPPPAPAKPGASCE